MSPNALLHEAQELKDISQRLESLADEHPHVSDALLGICGTVRNAAMIIEVLVATKFDDAPPLSHKCS